MALSKERSYYKAVRQAITALGSGATLKEKLDTIAKALIEGETLEKGELLALLEGREAVASPKQPLAAKGDESPEKSQEEIRQTSPIKGRPLPQPE